MKNIITQAISHYRTHNYEKALLLFQQAALIYGEEIVALQIQKCQEKLALSPIQHSATPTPSDGQQISYSTPLDPATQILLHNKGDKPLSSQDYAQALHKWQLLTSKKSQDAETKKVSPMPSDWPRDLQLAPLPEGPNDYAWHEKYHRTNPTSYAQEEIGLSVIIPTFNRSWILDITLACMVNQKTSYPYEVIVADDGSKEQIVEVVRKYEDKLDIKYVRQRDYGYQLCAVRNLGLRTAKYSFVSILDCDMAPNPLWVQSYLARLLENDDVALIGPRKYVDTHNMSAQQFLDSPTLVNNLPETISDNTVASTQTAVASIDWRLDHFAQTDNLRLCDSPFRFFSGGNVAFAKKWLHIAGWFDEEFTHWGGEDNEFGYRLFKHGCYFQSLDGGMAYHQEPPGKENETDRAEGKKITLEIVKEKVPYVYRKLEPINSSIIHRKPLVSIYIPAYNCSDSIVRCVDSALNQTVTDLEVCICNDGSTDNTLAVLQQHYGNHPRVHIQSKANGGIATASNAALKMAQGYYIGQLDSDDYLEPDAVELCLKEFLKNRQLACVYTTNRNVNPDGSLIANGYNWPEFSREKFTTAMIVHHFRMFTARAWHLTGGWDETIANSVDYDIFLKLSEIGPFKHLNKICYNRVLHGKNTSIKKLDIQKINHFKVVNNSLKRQGIQLYEYAPKDDDKASRKYQFLANSSSSSLTHQANTLQQFKLAFNIVCNGEPTNLSAKIQNLIDYNPQAAIIIIHAHPKYITQSIEEQAKKLSKQYNITIMLNSEVTDEKAYKLKQIDCYLSNYQKLTQSNAQYDYIILDNYDSAFIQHGTADYIANYDIGINLGAISGYWQSKILTHQPLHAFVQKYLPTQSLDALKAKGSCQGMFIKNKHVSKIFELVNEIKQNCLVSKQENLYHAEEVWFQMAYFAIKPQLLKHTSTLTYLPWDRKLQWTEQQIIDAQNGSGLPNSKFSINSILF